MTATRPDLERLKALKEEACTLPAEGRLTLEETQRIVLEARAFEPLAVALPFAHT